MTLMYLVTLVTLVTDDVNITCAVMGTGLCGIGVGCADDSSIDGDGLFADGDGGSEE